MSFSALARSALFAFIQLLTTPVFALIALATFPFPLRTRYRIITVWTRLNLAAARGICGIRYRVIGAGNIPAEPCIILCKHQSAWETMALQEIFPPQVWVVKRELLWVPFFGWGLAMLAPIAINRGSRTRALAQMLEQGRDRLARGFNIVIFPEGTRVAPGARGTYHAGGAWLAVKSAATVIPVAHNAGEYWRRNAFIKRPGVVTVSIGPPMRPGDSAGELNTRVQHWIENEMQRIAYEG